MKIKKIVIDKFRSISHIEVNFLPYMVFVGKNNSGKSNIMIALDVFFSNSAEIEDFQIKNGKRELEFSIIVHFCNFSDSERRLYKGKILNEGEPDECLVLRYRAELSDSNESVKSTKYEYSLRTLNRESDAIDKKFGGLFEENIYRSKSKIEEHKNIPKDFKKTALDFLDSKSSGRFTKDEFRTLRNKYIDKILVRYPHLEKLEYKEIKISSRNPSKKLGNFFFIPAVQDIEKETRYTGSGKRNLNNLMNYVLDQMQDPKTKRQKEEEIRKSLKEIYKLEESDSEIKELEKLLNQELAPFDNSKLSFDTELPNLSKLIRDSLKIYINDGIRTEVQYKGHGLQRYFMVILFKAWSQKLMEIRKKNKEEKNSKSVTSNSTYFAIEEPELFLHPQYQRMMKSYLQNIAEDDGHQVILNTHSPHFIEFDNLFQLAKVYKKSMKESTNVIQPLEFSEKGEIINKEFVRTWGSPQQKSKFREINRVNMNYYLNPNRNEMFFADKVILVEGQTEKMLFQAWGNYFYGDDIALINKVSYIDCLGKFNFQHYIRVLKEFEIPFVVVVDSDSDKSDKTQGANVHIKRDAIDAGGLYFELKPDFEGEFGIIEAEVDSNGVKIHKPYHAFEQFFENDGIPKEENIANLKQNHVLNSIFKAIYDREM